MCVFKKTAKLAVLNLSWDSLRRVHASPAAQPLTSSAILTVSGSCLLLPGRLHQEPPVCRLPRVTAAARPPVCFAALNSIMQFCTIKYEPLDVTGNLLPCNPVEPACSFYSSV